MEEVEKLRSDRARIYQLVKKYHSLMLRSESIHRRMKEKYESYLNTWTQLDRQLAVLDGRYVVEPPGKSKTRAKKNLSTDDLPDLTEEQIESLCEKFGIPLEEIPNDEDGSDKEMGDGPGEG